MGIMKVLCSFHRCGQTASPLRTCPVTASTH